MQPRSRVRVRLVPSACRRACEIFDLSPSYPVAMCWDEKRYLLTKLRRNRLIDTFLGLSAVAMSNRTTAADLGSSRAEADEVYLATSDIQRFVVAIFALTDGMGLTVARYWTTQAGCRKAYPLLTPRPVAVQFVRDDDRETIVMFALAEVDGEIRALDEKHYRLVPASDITADDLSRARLTPS